MSSGVFGKIVSLVLVVRFPAAMLFGETGGAMVYAKGAVSINGVNVSNTSSIFSGDRVDTADASAVTINQTGSSIAVNPNSSVRYEKNDVDVYRGTARVSTSNGMAARVDQLNISPKDKTAKFEIARLDNKVLVTSHEGQLLLSGAGKVSSRSSLGHLPRSILIRQHRKAARVLEAEADYRFGRSSRLP